MMNDFKKEYRSESKERPCPVKTNTQGSTLIELRSCSPVQVFFRKSCSGEFKKVGPRGFLKVEPLFNGVLRSALGILKVKPWGAILRFNLGIFTFFIILTSIFLILPVASEAATISKPPNNLGLVGYWSFNEGTSTIVTDFSGHGSNGSMSGFANPASATSGWGYGKIGRSLTFDGSDDYVNMGTPAALNLNTSAVTVSAWVKFANKTIASNEAIVSTGENGAFANQYYIRRQGDNSIRFTIIASGGSAFNTVTPSPALQADTWVHIVGVYNGTDARTYVNGVLTGSPSAVTGTILSNGMRFLLGASDNNGTIGNRLKGSIDEARVYNRALTATEVTELYKKTKAVVANKTPTSKLTNGLLGHWTFDGNQIDWSTDKKIFDSSGNGNSGTTTIATSTGPTIGKVGQALNFDGSGSYVSLGTGANLTPTTALSIVAWVYLTNTTASQIFFGKRDLANGVDPYECRINGGTNVRFTIDIGTETTATSVSNPISQRTWHHVVCTWDGANMNVYVDGILVAGPTAKTGTISNTSASATIGTVISSFGYFGKIDDVRLYNRALSTTEITQLYLMGR